MSFQAMTWAIEQRTGSPRAKCVLLSIANYANAQWCAYPKQELIAEESEQSADSVQKYLADLIGPGLVRRIKLKRFGRRTHDFLILKPSPLYEAAIEDILPHLPAGCDVMDDAAANSGSVAEAEPTLPPMDSETDAAASSGSVESTHNFPMQPPVAVDAADLQRQQEPVTNLREDSLPQTPSQAETQQAGEEEAADDGGRASESRGHFERFCHGYPIPLFNREETWRWWKALRGPADEDAAISGAIEYGHQCEKLKRRPKDAHKFLRDRIFDEFQHRVGGKFHAGDSIEARALRVLYEVAGKGSYFTTIMRNRDGTIWYPKAIAPQLLALAQAPPQQQWSTLDYQQARAWDELLAAFVTVEMRSRLHHGCRAPWPWPPGKDGKIYSTGPPETLMTDQDLRDFA